MRANEVARLEERCVFILIKKKKETVCVTIAAATPSAICQNSNSIHLPAKPGKLVQEMQVTKDYTKKKGKYENEKNEFLTFRE